VPPGRGAGSAATGQRPVYFGDSGWLETPIYARESLGAGDSFEGPAIVTQYDTTTVILPGQRVSVDAYGNLVVETRAGRVQAAPATEPAEAAG
jgi:N-methylhydantoinase A